MKVGRYVINNDNTIKYDYQYDNMIQNPNNYLNYL